MGRPINKRYFGTSADDAEIKVQFHNGAASVDGWIVKQLAARRFRCTDGAATADCRLVDKAAGALLEGEMSISVRDDTGTVHQVVKISGRKLTLGNGTGIGWNFDDSTTDGRVEMEEEGGAVVSGDVIDAVDMVDGIVYRIVDDGNTDFTLHGAASNAPGTVFTMAGAPAAGTGTVEEYDAGDTFGT